MAHTSSKTSVSNLFSLRILEKERLQSDTRVPDTLNRYPPISPYKTRFAPFFAKKVFGGNLCNFFGKRNFEKWLVLDLFFSLHGHPRRDARRGSVPTMRHQEEKRRRIVDVDTMASPNQAVDLRTTPGIIVFGPLSSSPRMASDPVENRFENFGPTIALGTRPAPNRLPKRSENSHTASSGAAPRLARFWRFYEPPSARYASAQSETAVFGYRR
jgi:hypothetical protein